MRLLINNGYLFFLLVILFACSRPSIGPTDLECARRQKMLTKNKCSELSGNYEKIQGDWFRSCEFNAPAISFVGRSFFFYEEKQKGFFSISKTARKGSISLAIEHDSNRIENRVGIFEFGGESEIPLTVTMLIKSKKIRLDRCLQ